MCQAHLLLAKCYKGLGDLKSCISCCNSAIEHNSKWKEAFLYRSACFQALHTAYLETDGDTLENIEVDRASADIIVDPNCTPTDVTIAKEEEAKRRLLRRESKKLVINLREIQNKLKKDGSYKIRFLNIFNSLVLTFRSHGHLSTFKKLIIFCFDPSTHSPKTKII